MNRLKWRIAVVMAMTLVCAATDSVRGDSLWQRRNPQRAYLTQDSRARNVGDLLTLIFSDSSDAELASLVGVVDGELCHRGERSGGHDHA